MATLKLSSEIRERTGKNVSRKVHAGGKIPATLYGQKEEPVNLMVDDATFVEAVLTYETDPGQGVPLELSWETLSAELRDALRPLRPGEVSRPVDFHGDTYLFQLESWLIDPAAHDADLTDRARDELEHERRRAGLEGLLRRLRRAMPLRIDEKRLPFSYVAESEPRTTP